MVISTVELLKTDVMPCQRRIFTRIGTWIPCTCPPQQKLLSLSFQSDVAVFSRLSVILESCFHRTPVQLRVLASFARTALARSRG